MGVLSTNDRNAFGQNIERLPASLRKNTAVEFRAAMDALRKQYETNHPLLHQAPKGKQTYRIRTAHQTNLPTPAQEYSRYGKAWYS